MATPVSNTTFGSKAGSGYNTAKIGLGFSRSYPNATQCKITYYMYLTSNSTIVDSTNNVYFNAGKGVTSASTNRGKKSINHTGYNKGYVGSPDGCGVSANTTKVYSATVTYTRKSESFTVNMYGKMTGIDVVGETISDSRTGIVVKALPTYTIEYNANGGTGAPSSQTKTHGVNLTLSSTVPTRASTTNEDGAVVTYTFKGWARDEKATVKEWSNGGSYDIDASDTLYAVWSTSTGSAATYDILYYPNASDVSNMPATQSKTKGTSITLSTTKPSRNGYSFSTWKTQSGTSYSSGATYSTDADLDLYAQWTAWTHTIAFNANGGSGAPSSITKTTGTEALIPETVPTKSGSFFRYWATNSDGTGDIYYPGDEYENTQNGGTVTLYAIWATNQILVYNTKNIEAVEFIEQEGEVYFSDGEIHNKEFIEDGNLYFNESGFHCKELIEG